ncbi:MAG TPA: Fe3+/spermidine/putrescine ABC transporter ATP-binding protein [Verrucomicrobiales bacterium]|nr:Fe3+/spermidine/putrescine ABC transporter ATP-binding protein [Verrucomicrobiales bacterium]
MKGPAVEAAGLTRRFGEVVALDDLSLSVAEGEFLSLLGPSGCGKTTLLRIIAGLDHPDAGVLRIGGEEALSLPAHRRPVNTVFQSYALFPHLNVRENVGFGLRMKRVPRDEMDRRVSAVMELVEIAPLAARRPSELSGGQKQRVALARAVVNEPKVLLLDEPLAALDLQLRRQLQQELRNLQRRLGITFLYVTHDQEEALALSDRIALIRAGRIEQLGEAAVVYERPRTRFASQFLGACSLLEGRVVSADNSGSTVETAAGLLRTRAPGGARQGRVTLAVRPEKIELRASSAEPGENSLPVRVSHLTYVGSETHYELEGEGISLRAEVMNTHAEGPRFRPGDSLQAHIPPGALILLDD